MNPHDDDGEKSFADLIGELRPIKGHKNSLAPPTPSARATTRKRNPKSGSPGSDGQFRWPEENEPRLAAAHGASDQQLSALRRGEPEPEERIDLHGVRRAAAPPLLRRRIESAAARGLQSVSIIHGKGGGAEGGESVLRDGLPGWLTTGAVSKHVLAIAPAPAKHGGEGATLVLLRRSRT